MKKAKVLISCCAVLVFFLLSAVADAQCAMCKAVAESGSEQDGMRSVGEQLNTGILYLMIIPYIIFFFLFRKRVVRFFREMNGLYRRET